MIPLEFNPVSDCQLSRSWFPFDIGRIDGSNSANLAISLIFIAETPDSD